MAESLEELFESWQESGVRNIEINLEGKPFFLRLDEEMYRGLIGGYIRKVVCTLEMPK
jgi:hypothetical protein